MISLPAVKLNQLGLTFYQGALSASDVEKLIRFEVLSYGETAKPKARGRAQKVNWEVLEAKIVRSAEAFQRPIIRRKIEDLVAYYEERAEHRDLPPIPGAIILVSEQQLEFKPLASNPNLGILQIPDVEGIMRTLDGQHRVLALYAYISRKAAEGGKTALDDLQIPAVIFDSLQPAHAVEMFVTINTKHTRLKADLVVTLAGRKLYPEKKLAVAHDIIRMLNEASDSPLRGDIRILGVGRGRVSQSPLASEMERLFTSFEAAGSKGAEDFYSEAKRFFLNYFKQIAKAFPTAWGGRKYSIKSGTALRAFIRVVPDIIVRLRQRGSPITDAHAIGEIIAPWQSRMGDARFETAGQWQQKMAGGGSRAVEALASELRSALA